MPEIKKLIENAKSRELVSIYGSIDTLSDIYKEIDDVIVEDPPFSIREGDIIKDGVNSDVDYLRSIMKDGKGWISKIEES